jgi:predicted HTH domain antitoxin
MDNVDKNIDILDKNISFSGLQLEFAVFLYERKIISLEQACNLADIDIAEIQYILGSRKIPIHYDIEDFEKDMLTLDTLKLNENSK